MRKRILLLFMVSLTVFSMISMSGVATAQSTPDCDDPVVWFDRAPWCGYFKDRLEQNGRDVRVGGIPGSVNTVQDLINLIMGDLNSGNAQRRTAAKFFIYTMIDLPAGTTQNPSASQLAVWIAEWQQRLKTYGDISENGTTSQGVNGRIDWFVWQHMPCNTKNTFYQDSQDDVAPYRTHAGNSDCEIPSALDDFIIIRNKAGNAIYMIRRECMNPMGVIDGLSDEPKPDFNLQPGVSAPITDAAGTPVPGSIAQVGDTVHFTFTVRNTGSTPSSGSIVCTIFGNNRTGYAPPPSPPTYSSVPGYIPPPISNCPPVSGFPINATTIVATEDVLITANNQTICRTLRVAPTTLNGTDRGAESCIYVANKPYLKVYGGDIAAGSGIESDPNTCANNTNGGIISWNRNVGAGYAGAGVQYAAYALSTIMDFATSQAHSNGAPAPIGLSFANTSTTVASGNFGGTLGSLPCIPDYYGRKPAVTLALPAAASAMDTGVYSSTGSISLAGGVIGHGKRVSVYVDGDLFLTGNITYAPGWDITNMPQFQLIVRGNLYIANTVTQLDGLYVAQRNGIGGTIYTCAITAAPPVLTDGVFFNVCKNRLTVNGAVVADSIELLRTAGTLSQATPGESSADSTAGEVFNFTPALWMPQPSVGDPRSNAYDAIISLPPVL